MNRRPMCLPKEVNKKKKRKKEKKKKKNLQRFALKPEHGPRGIWRKPLKPGATKPIGWGATAT